MNPERDLWIAVLQQAIKDKDKMWFRSKSKEVGSFYWICSMFSLDRSLYGY